MARDPGLDKLIQDIKTKQFRDGEAKGLMDKTGEELKKQFGPALEGMGKELTKNITEALKGLKMPEMPAMPEHKMPEIPAPIVNIPEFNIPAPQVRVNVPNVIVPPITVPETKVSFPTLMNVLLEGINRKNPLPVQMVDLKGNPFYEFGGGADSGPKTIRDIINTQGFTLIDSTTTPGSPALRISGTISAAAASSVSLVNADGTYYNSDNPLPVTVTGTGVQQVSQVSGHNWSVFATNPVGQGDSATALRVAIAGDIVSSVVVNSFLTSVAASLVDSSGIGYSGSNPVPVTGTVAATKSGTWAIDNPVAQGDAATALRVVIAGNSDSSVSATQVGTWNIGTLTTLTGVTNSVAVVALDRDGNPLTTGPIGQGDSATALRVVQANDVGSSVSATQVGTWNIGTVTSITNSTAVALTDSSGVQYSGSNPLPTTASLSVPQGQGDAATAMRVVVAGNSDSSVSVNSWNGNTLAVGTNETTTGVLRTILMSDTAVSTVVNSGTITTVTTVTGITNSLQTAIIDSGGVQYSGSNPLPITIVSGSSSGTQYNDGATPDQAGGIGVMSLLFDGGSAQANIGSSYGVKDVQLTGFDGSLIAITSNALNVFATNPVAQGDAATALRVVLAGNADSSVSVTSITGPIATGDAASALRVVIAGNSDSSVSVNSWNGNTVTTNQGETTAGTLRVIHAGDAAMSVFVTGQNDSMLTYMARTTLPTAKSDGADVRPVADKYGRPAMRVTQVRDLLATAYVSLATGTEATFLAASAGKIYDLVWVLLSNQSTASVQVDVRPILAGNILMTFQVPANGTVGIAPPVPLPGGADSGNAWTVDMPDITGTTVNITGLFSQEV